MQRHGGHKGKQPFYNPKAKLDSSQVVNVGYRGKSASVYAAGKPSASPSRMRPKPKRK